MKTTTILALSWCGCLLVSGVRAAEPAEDWEDPAVVGRGKEPPHATAFRLRPVAGGGS